MFFIIENIILKKSKIFYVLIFDNKKLVSSILIIYVARLFPDDIL